MIVDRRRKHRGALMKRLSALSLAFLVVTLFVSSCQTSSPQLGSQTNWIKACDTKSDCGALECICGMSTTTCESDAQSSELEGAECVDTMDAGAIALCDGQVHSDKFCMTLCDDAKCANGSFCQADACAPALQSETLFTIDPTIIHQALIGFGASLAYDENLIVSYPNKEALFDVMFSESGFDVIRIANRFEGNNETDLSAATEVVAAATDRLGRPPVVFITSGSPPDALKPNGNRYCSNLDPNCTLVRNVEGGFDYEAFAEHWRASLAAYANAGVVPDFVSIQNNADWLPGGEGAAEACRFLPEEGTLLLSMPDGQEILAEFPGYAQALAEVEAATSDLEAAVSFAAPEVGSPIMVGGYSESLADAPYDAIALHLYGVDPLNVPRDQLERVGALSFETGKPVIQSEMASDGFGTALLTHYTLTLARGAAYIQQPFVTNSTDMNSSVLIGLDGETIVTFPSYHALAHFARTTGPGWLRIETTADSADILGSSWISPDEDSLTVVLLNPTQSAIDVEVTIDASVAHLLDEALVTRTTFDGVERSANLGTLSPNRSVRVPARAILTIATAPD